jgi:formate-dependent nitrite reductase cytochrome c552 subunit
MPDRARFGVLVATDGSRHAQTAVAASVEFPWPKRASAERLMGLAENALLALMDAVQAATARGVRPEALGDARAFHRKAQWRLDFVAAENSKGFHVPQEAARILGEAIDFARQGQAAALTAGR